MLNAGEEETKDFTNETQDPLETKDDHNVDKVKRTAVTAISAAAVKAKLLADQEEDQIRQLATLLIDKQVIRGLLLVLKIQCFQRFLSIAVTQVGKQIGFLQRYGKCGYASKGADGKIKAEALPRASTYHCIPYGLFGSIF